MAVCRPSRDSVIFADGYPGLPSWALPSRPDGLICIDIEPCKDRDLGAAAHHDARSLIVQSSIVNWPRPHGYPHWPQAKTRARGLVPAGKGKFCTTVSMPLAPMVNPLRLLEPALATYKKSCWATLLAGGDKLIMAMGLVPARNGDPDAGVSLPVLSVTVKTDTSLEEELAT